MFNDTYKFILSYELTVDDIHFLQQRIIQCLGGKGCPFAENIQVL
jgi:hypothetical protein